VREAQRTVFDDNPADTHLAEIALVFRGQLFF
jgi:hypothetical protein